MAASPILTKELRTLLRTVRAFVFLLQLLLLCGGAFWLIWLDTTGYGRGQDRSYVSRSIFSVFSVVQLCVLGLLAPILTASAINGERERGTLDLLLCTGLPRLHILIAKWISAIAYLLLITLTLLPIFMFSFQLGGVGIDEYLFAGFLIALAVLTYSMVGLAFSACCRKSVTALMLSILFVLTINVFLPGLLIFLNDVLDWDMNVYGRRQADHLLFQYVTATSPLNMGVLHLTESLSRRSSWSVLSLTLFLAFHMLVMYLAGRVAWHAMVRGFHGRVLKNVKLIENPAVLAARRQKFPYYLIDPLARPQVIDDHRNPVIIKEQRVGAFSRLSTLIRIGYLAVFASFLLMLLLLTTHEPDPDAFMYGLGMLAFCIALLFMPLIAATAVSREREENTLDLLLASILPPHRIIQGKFWIPLRFMLVLIPCVMTLPALTFIISPFLSGSSALRFDALLRVLPLLAVFSAFYTAVAILCSAHCRRNLSAILVTYLVLGLLLASPFIAGITGEIARDLLHFRDLGQILHGLGQAACPFLTPFISLKFEINSSVFFSDGALFKANEDWTIVLMHACAMLLLTQFTLARAATVLRRRKG